MNKKDIARSKTLSWLLRFGAVEAEIQMDAAGWVAIEDVLAYTRLSRNTLDRLVETNSKQRLQVDGSRIRATQGHGRDMPVTADALEASWSPWPHAARIYHGTSVESAKAIARSRIEPQSRTHVHLSATVDSKVGKRAGVQLMLAICPRRLSDHGLPVYVSPNGVLLTRAVPADCVVDIVPSCRAARAAEADLRAAFGLATEPTT